MHTFVGLPETKSGKIIDTYLYKEPDVSSEKFRQVLWGDWLNITDPDDDEILPDKWLKVCWKPNSNESRCAYIPEEHTSQKRPLEIIFLDVGQGDGCVLVTPERDTEEAISIIDAGENQKMNEFLNKRFSTYKNRMQFHSAIITHPDKDHYLGFESIFNNHNIGFDVVYQNGLVEKPVSGTFEKIGGFTEDENGDSYLNEISEDKAHIEQHFFDDSLFGRFEFPPVCLSLPQVTIEAIK